MSRDLIKENKDNQIVASLNEHVKQMSRKVLRFDTTEEVVSYLSDIFIEELNSSLIAVALIEQDQLVLKAYSGSYNFLNNLFPLPLSQVNDKIFNKSMRNTDNITFSLVNIAEIFEQAGIASWFTIPIKDEQLKYGVCFVGYQEEVPLYKDLQESFDALGSFISIALTTIEKNKQKQRNLLSLGSNLPMNENFDNAIERITSVCGRDTHSQSLSLYLIDEENRQFVRHSKSFGETKKAESFPIAESDYIENYFPNVEKAGKNTIAVPLQLDMQTIGVLYGEKKSQDVYSQEDIMVLAMYADYFGLLFENFQQTILEEKRRQEIESILDIQQKFLDGIIKGNDFSSINKRLSELLNANVILFDRYYNLVGAYSPHAETFSDKETQPLKQAIKHITAKHNVIVTVTMSSRRQFVVNTINNGVEKYGYLAVEMTDTYYDEWFNLIIDSVKSYYALQFSNQQSNLDLQENVKDVFVDRFLKASYEKEDNLIEDYELFRWDLSQPIEIGVIDLAVVGEAGAFAEQARRAQMFKIIKANVSNYYPQIFHALVDNRLVLFRQLEKQQTKKFNWYQLKDKIIHNLPPKTSADRLVIGVSQQVQQVDDYRSAYEQAVQTTKVLLAHEDLNAIGYYERLGSYTLLNDLTHSKASIRYIKYNLQPLYDASKDKTVNLFHTLEVYLENNGNVKQTSEALFIHRSTLNYRLDKIRDILDRDIDDPDIQFDLNLAFKLYVLYDENIFI